MLRRHRRSTGQALVEFALAATLIFVLLSAAVDIGLIYFSLQAMRAAAQEGANYGSYPVMVLNPDKSVKEVTLAYTEIVNRTRNASGTTGNGFAKLLDLNNNGIDDQAEGILSPTNPNSYIYVESLLDPNGDRNPTDATTACRTTTPRVEMRNAGRNCYVRVTVRFDYKFIFPLAPVFSNTIPLRSSFIMPIRSSFIG